ALGTDSRALLAVLQRRRPPSGGLQHPRVAAAGGADVEGEARSQAANRPRDEGSPFAVPPVPVLELGQLADLGPLPAAPLAAMAKNAGAASACTSSVSAALHTLTRRILAFSVIARAWCASALAST